ncbi:hypothetical protein SAMN05660772_02055 [Pasteurella testudinis DSM 23072]|uniref:Uncharacterized protein n=1 Tax=Pasteurella testudinis DSM 23072 TaxID=1122938 RepID=A0A1W1UNE1_9PAST|nr:hypothetical protein [Pasteurella testudinis]SMB82321.1 hypothetical protein SAMN05660772_02055 [Pasteurella testudinis DSM 23072]SUB51493.1 Uncharacterised protein [Pasteurella testudinis]
MPKVKMSFSIEVDDEILVEHSIEYQRLYNKPRLSLEQDLATNTINRMNEISSSTTINDKNWKCLFSPRCYASEIPDK